MSIGGQPGTAAVWYRAKGKVGVGMEERAKDIGLVSAACVGEGPGLVDGVKGWQGVRRVGRWGCMARMEVACKTQPTARLVKF